MGQFSEYVVRPVRTEGALLLLPLGKVLTVYYSRLHKLCVTLRAGTPEWTASYGNQDAVVLGCVAFLASRVAPLARSRVGPRSRPQCKYAL